jgi:hypothetical protein
MIYKKNNTQQKLSKADQNDRSALTHFNSEQVPLETTTKPSGHYGLP